MGRDCLSVSITRHFLILRHIVNICAFNTGNLPTERVTKRDLFHIFHSYGKLAQISIKQAYGFIQFLEASSCKRALEGEQGAVVRGRKVRKCYGITDYKNIRITLTLSDRS
jgi:hypothetical protein